MFFKVSEKKLLKNEWGNLNNSLRSKEDDYTYRIVNMPDRKLKEWHIYYNRKDIKEIKNRMHEIETRLNEIRMAEQQKKSRGRGSE